MDAFIDYVSNNSDSIFSLFLDHIQLTALAIILSVAIGVPIGIVVSYFRPARKPVMAMANLIQAIPSMALLGFMIPLLGIGTTPAIFMVILYSLLPIIKNTYAGLQNINKDTLEAAKGIGLTPFQILYKVQIPLALPVIMAGVRISAVSAVGLMTLAAFIGAGGLGYLVYAGIRTVNTGQILAGAVPACILALFIDYICSIAERMVTPRSMQLYEPRSKGKRILDKMVILITCLLLVFSFIYKNMSADTSENTIAIGSMDFTEQEVLSYMVKELVEENTDIHVKQSLSLGSSSIVLDAIKASEIDMYIDYTGTIYGSVLGLEPNSDVEKVYNTVKKEMHDQYSLQVLPTLGFQNTYTLAVTKETAEKYKLVTISDLAKVSNQLILSPTLTFVERKDCLVGLQNTYSLQFKQVIPIDGSPRYTALTGKDSDVIDAYSTDGLLQKFDLVVLKDDKKCFPPYDAIPIINTRIQEKYPEVIPLLNSLSSYLSEKVMIDLNYKVDELKMNAKDVAHDFLKEHQLVK